MAVNRVGIAAIWNVATGRELVAFTVPEFPMTAIALRADGLDSALATGNRVILYAAAEGNSCETSLSIPSMQRYSAEVPEGG